MPTELRSVGFVRDPWLAKSQAKAKTLYKILQLLDWK